MEQIPLAEIERTMKMQEVMLRAMAKKEHVVAGGRDLGNQRSIDEAMASSI